MRRCEPDLGIQRSQTLEGDADALCGCAMVLRCRGSAYFSRELRTYKHPYKKLADQRSVACTRDASILDTGLSDVDQSASKLKVDR